MGAIALLDAPELDPAARETLVRRMLAAAPTAGTLIDLRHAGDLCLGVCRAAWETADLLEGPARVAQAGRWLVAADGRLAGGAPALGAAAEQLALQLDQQGARSWSQLHGDVAAVFCDVQGGASGAWRSFTGRRDLLWARHGRGRAAASSVAALLALGISADPDEEQLVLRASGLEPRDARTAFRAVSKVAAGQLLEGTSGSIWRETAAWTPPMFSGEGAMPQGSDAERDARLREALVESMRASTDSLRAGVLMSGGYDSTALFAAGRSTGVQDDALAAISAEYPRGSGGDERRYIDPVARRWGADVRWAPLPDIADWFAARLSPETPEAEPCEHLFGFGFESLAEAAASDGRVVVVDGGLGDLLFFSSPAHLLAEAVQRGAWRRAMQLRHDLGLGWRGAARTVAPLLRAGGPRARAVASPLLRAAPSVDLALERYRDLEPRRSTGVGPAQHQHFLKLSNPGQARLASQLHRAMWRARVILRAPLAHPAVLSAAAAAPTVDRWQARQAKVGLRRAMRGWIPDDVLAARPNRTGMPSDLIFNGLRVALARVWPARWDLLAPDAVQRARADLQADRMSDERMVVMGLTLLTAAWVEGHAARNLR